MANEIQQIYSRKKQTLLFNKKKLRDGNKVESKKNKVESMKKGFRLRDSNRKRKVVSNFLAELLGDQIVLLVTDHKTQV